MDGGKVVLEDEVDLTALFETLWAGRWTILISIVIAALSTQFIQSLSPQPNFSATTDFRPIPSFEAERYRLSNAVGVIEIQPEALFDLYVEQLQNSNILETSFQKFKLLERENFETDFAYDEALIALAASINISQSENTNTDTNAATAENSDLWQITFAYHNKQDWKVVLQDVHNRATEAVKEILKTRFDVSVAALKQARAFELEDISLRIENLQALAQTSKQNRLAFLREQAAIARTLDIPKSTIEAQTFDLQTGIVAKVGDSGPFYLRGYVAIEKEIDILEARQNFGPFITELPELEQRKRAIEKDKTIERAEKLFSQTPIFSTDFTAVSMKVAATDFAFGYPQYLIVMIVAILGGMLGIIYVLISKLLLNWRRQTSYFGMPSQI